MKKIVILAGMLLLVASSAFAEKGDMWFGVSAGMGQPTGDAGDVLKSGFGGTLFGSYGIAKSCAVGIEAGYLQFKGDDNDDFTFTVMPVTAFTTYTFPMSDPKQKPYVKLGLGMYNGKAELDDPVFGFDESETDFGFNVGAGYDFEMSPKFTLGALASYHSIQTEDESTNILYFAAKLGFGVGK